MVLREGSDATAADLMAFIAGKVAPYKKIREVEFMQEIPKTLSGKILRRDLIQRESGRSPSRATRLCASRHGAHLETARRSRQYVGRTAVRPYRRSSNIVAEAF